MVIDHRLSNDQLLDLQLGSDERSLESARAALVAWTNTAARQPEAFWWRQQAQIRQRIAESERQSRRRLARLAWAGVFALVLAAGALLRQAPAPEPQQVQLDSDHELLIEIERVMQSDGPDSLAPATLLVQEVSQKSNRPESHSYEKEITHEN